MRKLKRTVFNEFSGMADIFRALSQADIEAIPTVKVVDVSTCDSLGSFSDEMLGGDFRDDRIEALNNIEDMSVPGARLLLIVDGWD